MPRFKKGSKEAKEWGAMMKAKRGKHGEGFLDEIKNIGSAVGKPFEASVGVNPFNLGYTLGHDVIAPALMGRGEAKYRAGGSVGAYEETITQQGGQRYGNTNNGVMRVPFANTPYPIHIAGIAGRNGVPEKSGRGTISMYGKYIPDADEYTTHNGDAYNWRTGMKTYTPAYGMLGRGVIDQLNNVGYTAQAYNQTNLGANGVVRVK